MNRLDVIKEHIKWKEILDIGSAWFESDNYFFKFIRENAWDVDGLELDNKLVEKYKEYNIKQWNAETYISEKKYELIIAWELIEHLWNPGWFFKCSQENLIKNWTLILTTPNPYSFQNISRHLFTWKEAKCKEHVTLYSEITIKELANRYGFNLSKLYFVQREKFWWVKWWVEYVTWILFPHLRPRIIFIFNLK